MTWDDHSTTSRPTNSRTVLQLRPTSQRQQQLISPLNQIYYLVYLA